MVAGKTARGRIRLLVHSTRRGHAHPADGMHTPMKDGACNDRGHPAGVRGWQWDGLETEEITAWTTRGGVFVWSRGRIWF